MSHPHPHPHLHPHDPAAHDSQLASDEDNADAAHQPKTIAHPPKTFDQPTTLHASHAQGPLRAPSSQADAYEADVESSSGQPAHPTMNPSSTSTPSSIADNNVRPTLHETPSSGSAQSAMTDMTLQPSSHSPPLPLPTLPASASTNSFAPHGVTGPRETALWTAQDIQAFVARHIERPPPTNRPVRVYADGVYDLFHLGHALQLRQAKFSFPNVQLVVGVASDEDCHKHKTLPCLSAWERAESVRHCRWVDEVIEGCPWVITPDFIARHQIDYVAHDDAPYVSAGSEDIYAFVKRDGRFVPTRRTDHMSTSDILARVVRSYRDGQWDSKFDKIGMSELRSTPASDAGSVGSDD